MGHTQSACRTELGARSQTPKGPQTSICFYVDIQMRSSQKLCWRIVKRESKCNFQEASQKVHHSQSPGWYRPQINDFPFSIFYIILKQCQSFGWKKIEPGSPGKWRPNLGLGGCHGRSQKPPRRFHHPLYQGQTLGNFCKHQIIFRLAASSFLANLRRVYWYGPRQTESGPITRR